ncbi:6266_t:CDS:2, partial [Racocetra fulgida]
MLPAAFAALNNPCLQAPWAAYGAWPGAIAMMAALFVFFTEYIALKMAARMDEANKEETREASEKQDENEHLHHQAHTALSSRAQIIGFFVHESYNPNSETALIVQGIFDSISAGILLYAALVELIANDFIYDQDFQNKTPRNNQIAAFSCLIVGAGIMAAI